MECSPAVFLLALRVGPTAVAAVISVVAPVHRVSVAVPVHVHVSQVTAQVNVATSLDLVDLKALLIGNIQRPYWGCSEIFLNNPNIDIWRRKESRHNGFITLCACF
jgi:hypothetical protein